MDLCFSGRCGALEQKTACSCHCCDICGVLQVCVSLLYLESTVPGAHAAAHVSTMLSPGRSTNI